MNQPSLFPNLVHCPEGFAYQSDFLSVEDEANLLSFIRDLDFAPFDFHGYQARRRVVQYGWTYDFGTREANVGRQLPDFLLPIRDRAAEFAGIAWTSPSCRQRSQNTLPVLLSDGIGMCRSLELS